MVSNTTIDQQGAKSVCLKTTGHEKCMVSICLAAKADATKLKPLALPCAAKRESKSLDEEFRSCYVVKMVMPGWTKNYHLSKMSFSLRLLQMPYDWQHEKRFEGYECR